MGRIGDKTLYRYLADFLIHYPFFARKLPAELRKEKLWRRKQIEIKKSCFAINPNEKSLISVRHVTGTGTGLLGKIPRVVVQKSALL